SLTLAPSKVGGEPNSRRQKVSIGKLHPKARVTFRERNERVAVDLPTQIEPPAQTRRPLGICRRNH
ncbi:uncharacterized protein CCOS01_06816, partial [Colletotrichum costaricense]